ncbi:MAG: tRNA (N6-isopentenyl adenosine(37)-C2)-methylthiotransferase MiaB [Bdellovibrionota bacterium]|nr:tRNA (N6-isopentenyl adenosine(37)-C2)-methylthiotransferase MiaB [Pseudomonadota bacterium]MDY6089965.1 tRNA (N6-isopentenyl adenosine(37)-C2)-methylthiotransferase MiaB [Bdellovibrionota bacterium]
MKKKLYVRTYGCQMNAYDSVRIKQMLSQDYEETDTTLDADLIIINTCSVRKKPEEKLFAVLGTLKPLKQKNKNLIIGVGGCVAQQYGSEIIKRVPHVDFVFGTHNLSLIPEFIKDSQCANNVKVDYREKWEDLPVTNPYNGALSISVAISRGCNNRCAYCIVPQTRGPEVSRPSSQIIDEISLSVEQGTKEVLLLGQCVNSYGSDLEEDITFEKLLDKISKINGLERIRFTSPHPKHITDEFIDLVCSNPKICRHVHLPLQAGSNRILELMNRKYTKEHYLEIIEKIRRKVPDMAFTTDIIVGFPTETESDFLETVGVVEKVGFVNSYSFVYSPRPNTKSLELKDDISYSEKLGWLNFLQDRQYEVSARVLKDFIGKTTSILVDGYSKKDKTCLKGTNSQNITVNLSKDYSNVKLGSIIDVEVKDISRLTLKA